MGYSVGEAQCLGTLSPPTSYTNSLTTPVAPPYAFAAIIMYATGYIGDKYHVRGPIICFNMLLCIIGIPIMGFHANAGVRYFGVFLTTAGANSNIPATMSYQANNIRGQWKRAFCSATLVGFGGIGGIAGSLVFREQDKPTYHPGLYACLACCLLNLILVSGMSVLFFVQNRKAERGEMELETSAVSTHSQPYISSVNQLTNEHRRRTTSEALDILFEKLIRISTYGTSRMELVLEAQPVLEGSVVT
jgi:MFS family permease